MPYREVNPTKIKIKTQFKLTSSTWINVLKPSITEGRESLLVQYNPQCTRKHNYIEIQLRVHVISPKKMGLETGYLYELKGLRVWPGLSHVE